VIDLPQCLAFHLTKFYFFTARLWSASACSLFGGWQAFFATLEGKSGSSDSSTCIGKATGLVTIQEKPTDRIRVNLLLILLIAIGSICLFLCLSPARSEKTELHIESSYFR